MKNTIARLKTSAKTQDIRFKSRIALWPVLCRQADKKSDREYWGKARETHYVNVYEHGRAYGGPEEGGWYYDCFDTVATFKFPCRMLAEQAKKRIAAMYNNYTEHRIYVEKGIGASDTNRKPRPYYC